MTPQLLINYSRVTNGQGHPGNPGKVNYLGINSVVGDSLTKIGVLAV